MIETRWPLSQQQQPADQIAADRHTGAGQDPDRKRQDIESGQQGEDRVVADMFVPIKDDGLAHHPHLDGQDLIDEPILAAGGRGAAMALESGVVLGGSVNAVALGRVLGRHTHVVAVEGIGQRPRQAVDYRRIAHLHPEPRGGNQIGRAAHGLRAAGDGEVRLTQLQRLGRRHHRASSRQ